MPAFKGRDVISIRDFSAEELLFILDAAEAVEKCEVLRGLAVATVFYPRKNSFQCHYCDIVVGKEEIVLQ